MIVYFNLVNRDGRPTTIQKIGFSLILNANWNYTIFIFLFSFAWLTPLYPDSIPADKVQNIIDSSTFTRIQKPIAIRTDRKTLEYFMDHVEELTKHGRDFNRKELMLEVKGNGKYGIQMPSKHITGEFELVERQTDRVTYLGYGNATVFFSFSGTIVLEIEYSTQKDEIGYYEEVKTVVHLKFDNSFLAVLAKAASPILNPKLDKLINKFSTKIKRIVEDAYTKK